MGVNNAINYEVSIMSHSPCKGACSQFGAFDRVDIGETELIEEIESALGHNRYGLEIIYNKDGKRVEESGFASNKVISLMYKPA